MSSSGSTTPRAASGSAVIKATHPSAYNTVQYTATVVEPEYTVNLDVLYDEGHAERYNNDSVARIMPQLEELQRIFWNEFGICINYSTPTQYESLADTCPKGIDQICECYHKNGCQNSEVSDGTIVHHAFHHKNDTNVLFDIPHPTAEHTLRVAFTGHKLCHNYGECVESQWGGVANSYLGTALIIDNTDNAIEFSTKTLIHEFGHFLGANDHYKKENDNVPSTDVMNENTEGRTYSKSCIYGEWENGLDIEIDNLFCDGCRYDIHYGEENWP